MSALFLMAGCGGSNNNGADTPPTSPGPPQSPPTGPAEPGTSGLDARPGNKTCLAPERSTGGGTLGTQRVFPNLTFKDPTTRSSRNPLLAVQAPGDSTRWFVMDRFGQVHVFDNDPNVATASMFLDIGARVESACGECGMLGMAFHPDFPANPRVYLSYTSLQRTDNGPDTHLSEFTTRDGGRTLDPGSERVIMTIKKRTVHHHGGNIIFGRDRLLYMSAGDGNAAQVDNAQRTDTVLGKILRIDINGTTGAAPYRIPQDNPFASSTTLCNANGTGPQACPEIYAMGFRNPWRWSFDRQTGEMWVGDVGETQIEEVDRVVRGGNYGWRCFEGTSKTTAICGNPVNPIPPIAQYDHTLGAAVTGGYVYRGKAAPSLVGRYIFGDFASGRIWDIPANTPPTQTMTGGFESGLLISSFAQDNDGELYVVSIRGDLHRITGGGAGGGPGAATRLSATGCVSAADPKQPASGLIPYTPSASFWSDGAAKERWIALPDGQNISVGDDGDWEFPTGTVLMKNFRLANRLVETRLFMRHPDGVWAGYSYEWNAQGTDATLVADGKQASVGGQTWIYPSEAQCMECHTQAAGNSLGIETKQLATSITYPQTGRSAHQLVTLNSINVLSPPIANPVDQAPYADPTGTAGTLTERARAYLHTNCSQCHRPGGPTPSDMDLRYSTALADTHACNATPTLGDLGLANARLIAPGASARSVIPERMSHRGDSQAMPPVGSARPDTAGVKLIRDWVDSLTTCN
ncbi:MAG TPA: PQQ-dependent sugar dehydrogenase [Steroidobacteraceae bacterium]|nr:PQQ-dependent sugar dehydrogenase [Steroidobacteraceae bacterium]